MGIEHDVNEFFAELNEASARMDELLSRVETVAKDGMPGISKRKEEIAILVGIMAEGLSRGTAEDLEAFAHAVATLYMIGFYDGKQKGESQ